MTRLKQKSEIDRMRRAGRLLAAVLDEVEKAVGPDVSTADLDGLAERLIRQAGARPAFKGYRGYPATLCTSLNNEVVHGIPDLRKLRDGDIISLDLGVELNGFYADAAVTCPVGTVTPEAARLIEVTREALFRGIAQAVPGKRMGDLGHAVQSYAEANGYSVIRDLVGHGIGKALHEDLQVPNYGRPGRGVPLKEGMTLAVEPMISAGDYEVRMLADGWTIVTADNSLVAHFEHTIAIGADGPDILTRL